MYLSSMVMKWCGHVSLQYNRETVLYLEQKSNLNEIYRRQHNCQQKKDKRTKQSTKYYT